MTSPTNRVVNRPDLHSNAAALSQQALETNMLVSLRRASGIGAFSAPRRTDSRLSDAKESLQAAASSFDGIGVGGSAPEAPVTPVGAPQSTEDWRFASSDRWLAYAEPEEALNAVSNSISGGQQPVEEPGHYETSPNQLAAIHVNLPNGPAEIAIGKEGVQSPYTPGVQATATYDAAYTDQAYDPYGADPFAPPGYDGMAQDSLPPEAADPHAHGPAVRPFGLDDIDFS